MRYVDTALRQQWTQLGQTYVDLRGRLDDHMARQRLNAGLAVGVYAKLPWLPGRTGAYLRGPVWVCACSTCMFVCALFAVVPFVWVW